MLLDAELRSRLQRLSLQARGRVRSQWSGRHASLHKGESVDFADYREYVPGDDFRRIDHNLWARLGQVLVRRFEAEEELPVRIVLDVSASMQFWGKQETARTLAGVIAYLALGGGDRVIPAAVPGGEGRAVELGPTARHLSSWPRLENWLETVSPGGAAPLGPVLRSLLGESPVRGPLVLVSDLLDEEWERTLDGLGLAAGGLVLQVLAPEELDPTLSGDLTLVDVEHGREVEVSASEASLRSYRAGLERFVEGVAVRARRAGLDYLLVPAGREAPDRLLEGMASAGAVR